MKKNNTMRNMTVAAIIGGAGIAGYMYMKKNPAVMQNVKTYVKDVAMKKLESMNM